MKKMYFIPFLILAAASSAFITGSKFQIYKKGCQGSNCHLYQPGMMEVKSLENLKVQVVPRPEVQNSMIGAELIDPEGRLVDFQDATSQSVIELNAPQPGKYKVLVGYNLEKPYWDSSSVKVKPSVINLPTSRFSAATLKLLPVHPNPAHRATLLRFILPHQSEVEVNLYTLAGKKVKTIFKGSLAQGIHEIYWETRDAHRRLLPTGNYLCELRSGTKKIVQRVFIRK